MTQQTNNAVDELTNRYGEASQHEEGFLAVTDQHVCKSNAGYYIGTYCIEVIGNQWLPQPYCRNTGYMSEKQAIALLASWSA